MSNFGTTALNLEANQRLAFNYENNQFFVVEKGLALPKNSTAKLAEVVAKVEAFVKGIDAWEQSDQELYVVHNVNILKERCQTYNDRVKNHKWLSRLDRFISFITCGYFEVVRRLQYNTRYIETKAQDHLTNRIENLLINSEIDDFLQYATLGSEVLSKEEYETNFLQIPIRNFYLLTKKAKDELGVFLGQVTHENADLIDFNDNQSFQSLLDHVVKCVVVGIQYPIEEVVFKKCMDHLESFSNVEKRHLNKMLYGDILPQTLQGKLLFLKYSSTLRQADPFLESKYHALFGQIVTTKDITQEDLRTALRFINYVPLHDREGYFQQLDQDGLKICVNYMKKLKSSEIGEYNQLIIYLSAVYIDQNQDGFIENEDEQDYIAGLLQRVNVSTLKENEFDQFINGIGVKEIVGKDPDLYLASASEDQLEKYYSPQESNLSINEQHYQFELVNGEVAAPPLPPGVVVNLSDLNKMFKQINFTNPGKADYIDPNTLTDDGQRVSVQLFESALSKLVLDVQQRRQVGGAPNRAKDPLGHEKYYTNLERYLSHIVMVLNKKPVGERSVYLIAIAGMGIHCGIRYMVAAQDLYCQLTGAAYNIEAMTVQGGLLKLIAARRYQILTKSVQDATLDVHTQMGMLKSLGAELGIPEAKALDFEDIYVGGAFNLGIRMLKGNVKAAFNREYTPTVVVNEITKHLEGIPGHPRTVKRLFHEAVDSWFKENIPEEYRDKYPPGEENNFLFEVYEMETGRIRRKWVTHLLQEMGVLHKPGANRGWLSLIAGKTGISAIGSWLRSFF